MPTILTRRCMSIFRRRVRRPIKRGWWMVRFVYYPAVRSCLLRFYRQVLHPYYKCWSHFVRQRYYQVRRLFRLGMKTLRSSVKSGYRHLRLRVRTLFGLGPPTRHRSSRGYRRWGRRLRRRRLAYGLVLKCRYRVHNLLPGSVHWRRNQRRLAYNRTSKLRSSNDARSASEGVNTGLLCWRRVFFIVLDLLQWWLIQGIYSWLDAAAEFVLVYFGPPPSPDPPDTMVIDVSLLRSFLRSEFRGSRGCLSAKLGILRYLDSMWQLFCFSTNLDEGEFSHEAELPQLSQAMAPHSVGHIGFEGDSTLTFAQRELLLWYWGIDTNDTLVSEGDNVAPIASISPALRFDNWSLLAKSIRPVYKIKWDPSGQFKKIKARLCVHGNYRNEGEPRWSRCSRMGQQRQFSPELSSYSGSVSRQYHVVFDEHFETCCGLPCAVFGY